MLYGLIKGLIRRHPDLAHALFRRSHNPDYQIPDETIGRLAELGYMFKGSIRSNVLLFVSRNVGIDIKERLFLTET